MYLWYLFIVKLLKKRVNKMLFKTNFHTHTKYCDGKNLPREMVKKAVELGFSALGFSGHAYTPCEPEYSMLFEDTEKYKKEILALRKEYRGVLDIYCGIEMDYYSEENTKDFDYVIGSVHYLEKDGAYYNVDGSPERFARAVAAFGDVYTLIEAYYDAVADVVRKTDADIIGHFDLITKFNENEDLFSTSHPRYVAAVEKTLASLIPTGKIFEINTGAMARGYRKNPYPSLDILKKLCENGAKLLLTSDCHDAMNLDFGFEEVLSSEIGKLASENLIKNIEEIPFIKK